MNSRDDVAKFMYACDQNGSDFGPQAELYVDLMKNSKNWSKHMVTET